MARWDEMHERAKKLISEGMTLIKSGVHDAEFIAETTANAARLHMDAGRKRYELYRMLHDVGAMLLSECSAHPGERRIELPLSLMDAIDSARRLSAAIEEDESKLDNFSIVRGESGRKATQAAGEADATPPCCEIGTPAPKRSRRPSSPAKRSNTGAKKKSSRR